MARLEKQVTVELEGRDRGKNFLITEMAASAGERWVQRAWLAVARSGIPIPDGMQQAGWAGIAYLSLQALRFTNADELAPLLDELMKCVQALPSPNVKRALIEEDIEEITTRIWLKKEVFDLHMGPFVQGASLIFGSAPVTKSPDSPTT